MKFNNVVIESIGVALPELYKSSEELENELHHLYEKLKISTGRLELMTGIKSRGYWEPKTPPSSISTLAALDALSNVSFKREDIDLLIHSGVCRDFLEPATASVIHDALKLSPKAQIFDLSNACLGFLNAIVVAGNMIEAGMIKRALIVTGENSGPLIKQTLHKLLTDESINRKTLKKYFANLTIGSAGVAMVISHKSLAPLAPEVLGASALTDSTANKLCRGDGNTGELMMETDSEELMHHGLKLAKENFELFKEELKLDQSSIDVVLTHQVGSAHEKLSLESVGLDSHRTYRTYPEFGNTGSAALPLTLALAAKNKQLNHLDTMALLGIGSGLSSIMLGIKWKQ